MRVLSDFVHGELFDSLIALFEDRFGWDIYRPLGREWHAAGVWQAHPHVVPLDYLDAPGAVLLGDHHEIVSPDNPKRRHKLVTWQQFRDSSWDFVLVCAASHEHRWCRLASEIGARPIRYVGNAAERVDWSLPFVVLAASSVELRGRGVVYHPEFSLADHPHDTAGDRRRIASFVSHFPRMTPAYEDWLSLQAALPEFAFREHGIGGRDGVVTPSAAVGTAMGAAGWGFHNKPIGDGYGFIIHKWAAMGRPLIGRARYFSGLLAAPFWRDGVTSIDLGAPRAAERIREIAADPARYGAMSRALASRFRELVDFDAEAEQIRALLA